LKGLAVGAPRFQSRLHRWRRYRQIEEAKRCFEGLEFSRHENCLIDPPDLYADARPASGIAQSFGRSEIRIRFQGVEELLGANTRRRGRLIRKFLVEALREEGYDVIRAANGEEARAWCGRRVADVLITDVRLPGRVDGWQIEEVAASMIPNSR
jgi:hypothetical protein